MEVTEGNSNNNDLEVKGGFCPIDFSAENDSLIVANVSSSSTAIDHQFLETQMEPRKFELTGELDAHKLDNTTLTNGQNEQLPLLLETSEPERLRKTGKCNLRKSLAWDSAFFENPGVLDAEELSSMIEGVEKGKKHLLPGIEEDISTSTDSMSTLVSDDLTLETLEAELFEDIRASIQKSSKASNTTNSNHKAATVGKDNKVNRSAKKVDLTSRNRITTNAVSKKQNNEMQRSSGVIKQVTQPVSRNGKFTSSIPKVISKPEPISTLTTKRATLSANRVKTETDNVKAGGKGIQVPKAVGLAGPRRTVPRPALSSKLTSSTSLGATKKEATQSSSSCDSSSSSLSDQIRKSPLTSARRKIESKPVIKPSNGFPKASSKVPLRKNPSDKSGLSTYLTSSKIASSISPTSSISEWSSASSSTSTFNPMSKSRASIDTGSSCRSLDSDIPPVSCKNVQSNDHLSGGTVNKVKELLCPDIKKASPRTGVVSRSTLMKPSGLRMPSPKIGFFDGAKSVVRTPTGGMQSQSRLPTGLLKMGAATTVGSSNKARDGNLSPGILQDTSKSASPKPFQESLRASKKVPSALKGAKSPTLSSDIQYETGRTICSSPFGSSNKATGKLRPGTTIISPNTKTEGQKSSSPKPFEEALTAPPSISPEVHDETDDVPPKAEKNENQGNLEGSVKLIIQGNADVDEIKIAPFEGDICDSSTDNYIEHSKLSHAVAEGKTHGEQDCVDDVPTKMNSEKSGHLAGLVAKDPNNCLNSQSEVGCQKEEISVDDLVQSCTRTPLAAKDSICNIEGFDFSTGS